MKSFLFSGHAYFSDEAEGFGQESLGFGGVRGAEEKALVGERSGEPCGIAEFAIDRRYLVEQAASSSLPQDFRIPA